MRARVLCHTHLCCGRDILLSSTERLAGDRGHRQHCKAGDPHQPCPPYNEQPSPSSALNSALLLIQTKAQRRTSLDTGNRRRDGCPSLCSEGTGTAGTSSGFSRAPHPPRAEPASPGPSVGCPEGPLCTQDTERGPSEVDPQLGPAQGQGRGHTAHKNQAHSGRTSLQPSEAGLPASDHRRVTEEAGLQGAWEKQGAVPGDHQSGPLN